MERAGSRAGAALGLAGSGVVGGLGLAGSGLEGVLGEPAAAQRESPNACAAVFNKDFVSGGLDGGKGW